MIFDTFIFLYFDTTSILRTFHRIRKIMRVYCEEASRYSEEALSPFKQPRHVTVILNPVAKGRKANDTYQKYISPILNCSGMKVSLVVTEREGEARELMEVMEKTDAVILSGGSGTIHEAVTGMLRRRDGKIIPLAFLPVGKLNSSAFNVHGISFDSLRWSKDGKSVGLVRAVAESTMAVVRETMTRISVLDVESLSRKKHVYAVNCINFGSIRDILTSSDKFWYFGNSMKPYLALISRTLFQDLKTLKSSDLSIKYTDPCSGCSKCGHKYHSVRLDSNESIQSESGTKNRRWWTSFVPKKNLVPKEKVEESKELAIDYSSIVNENCGVWKELDTTTVGLINLIVQNDARDGRTARVLKHSLPGSGEDLVTKGSLITDAGRLFQGQTPQHADVTIISDAQVRVKVNQLTSNNNNLTSSKNNSNNSTNDERKISIDGEEYELDDLNITLLPRKIPVYTSSVPLG